MGDGDGRAELIRVGTDAEEIDSGGDDNLLACVTPPSDSAKTGGGAADRWLNRAWWFDDEMLRALKMRPAACALAWIGVCVGFT